MEYFPYIFCEAVKDRQFPSSNYPSVLKDMCNQVHIIMLCKEQPDLAKMSTNRFDVRNYGMSNGQVGYWTVNDTPWGIGYPHMLPPPGTEDDDLSTTLSEISLAL